MSTRLYLPSSGAATVYPASSASWEDTSIVSRLKAVLVKTASAMTTVSFSDSNAADKDILFRQYISEPITAQTITAQSIKFQMRCLENETLCNMFLTIGIRVVSNDGATVRGTILAVTRDNTEAALSLTNRQFTANSSQVISQDGDRIVIEIGMGGDPGSSANHSSSISIGDDSGTDLPENNTATSAYNPWVEFANTIVFGLYSTQTEVISLNEALKFLASKALAENISLAEVLNMLISPTYTESVTITDACEALIVTIATQEEGIDISDFIEMISGKFFAEGISIADAIVFLAYKLQSETITLTDLANFLIEVSGSETVTISDAITKLMSVSATEGINISDIMSSYIFFPNMPLAKYNTRILIDMLLDSGTKHFSTEDIYITE